MAKVSPGTETKVFPIHAKLPLLLQLVNSNFTERERPQRAITQQKTEVESLELRRQDFTFMMIKWIFRFCLFVTSFINFHLIYSILITAMKQTNDLHYEY